ncbi:MAG: hypothetical protein EXR27_16840 [Betaproteobacteria bacterium]|nr:hypothetical protein [Betaproteobacteria bacterium]
MNKSQAILLAVAAGNLAVMLLFPPYNSTVIGVRGVTTFDAFYFYFDTHHNRIVDNNLLLLETYWVLVNSAIGWLLLRHYSPQNHGIGRRTALIIAVALNLALVFLFPPLENYVSTLRLSGSYFDGFYFLFGDKWNRRLYIPLLYMETLWILINGLVLWLCFREESGAIPGQPQGK